MRIIKNQTTDFETDLNYGSFGEKIFRENFLEFLNIKYLNVTNSHAFQVIDSDYLTKIGLYEIKLNYKDNKQIIIEEFTNYNEELAPSSKGWFYKSKADLIVFISKITKTMIFLPMTEQLKNHYEEIKGKYQLEKNKISIKNGRMWQSAFRRISFNDLIGYISVYKKLEKELQQKINYA